MHTPRPGLPTSTLTCGSTARRGTAPGTRSRFRGPPFQGTSAQRRRSTHETFTLLRHSFTRPPVGTSGGRPGLCGGQFARPRSSRYRVCVCCRRASASRSPAASDSASRCSSDSCRSSVALGRLGARRQPRPPAGPQIRVDGLRDVLVHGAGQGVDGLRVGGEGLGDPAGCEQRLPAAPVSSTSRPAAAGGSSTSARYSRRVAKSARTVSSCDDGSGKSGAGGRSGGAISAPAPYSPAITTGQYAPASPGEGEGEPGDPARTPGEVLA